MRNYVLLFMSFTTFRENNGSTYLLKPFVSDEDDAEVAEEDLTDQIRAFNASLNRPGFTWEVANDQRKRIYMLLDKENVAQIVNALCLDNSVFSEADISYFESSLGPSGANVYRLRSPKSTWSHGK